MTGTAHVLRANARRLPLADDSVDLVVTSPPYFALRSYQDGGAHYSGQIGDEPTPAEFVASLLEVTRECVRVLKPSGSLFVNLGDKYVAHPAGNKAANLHGNGARALGYQSGDHANNTGLRTKSLIGIPWRYALACIDDLGLILRAEVIWSKPNGLPESVTDRVRRSHEVWFHFTREPRYFSAVDEIREAHERATYGRQSVGRAFNEIRNGDRNDNAAHMDGNPLGKLPGSVWTIPTEPLTVPDHLGVDHFAAFPTEWPKRIIAGWSPAGVCVECGEGRRPVPEVLSIGGTTARAHRHIPGYSDPAGIGRRDVRYEITGYACACPEPTAATTPGVVADVFGGTGTTAMVAKALGRTGISIDMSADYCRLARWRVNDLDQLAKAQGIKRSDAARAADNLDMDSLFDLDGGAA